MFNFVTIGSFKFQGLCLTVFSPNFWKQAQQRATQDQIAYFGQTPSQLLTVPHLKKKPLADVLHLQVYGNVMFVLLKMYMQHILNND